MAQTPDPIALFQAALSALNAHLEELPDVEKDRALDRIIPDVVPLFHATGVDEMHNHRYRERYLSKIIERMLVRGKGLHGPDRLASLQVETKTVAQKTLTLSEGTGVGEIDKIHLKMGDTNYMGGKTILLCALFHPQHGVTFACSVQPDDLVAMMKAHVAPAAAALRSSSADPTQKKRDAFRIPLSALLDLPSFHVEHLDGRWLGLAPSLAGQPAFKKYKDVAKRPQKG